MHPFYKTIALAVMAMLPIYNALSYDRITDGNLDLKITEFETAPTQAYKVIYTGTTGKVVDSHADNADLNQWQDFGNDNQRWTLDSPDGSLPNITTSTGGILTSTTSACAGFCEIDNFDARVNGSIRTQGNWQINPPGSLLSLIHI